MKERDNLSIYFPVYRRIEKEVLNLTSAIYFSDDQLGVYSLDIADLIVRCVVEIESIAKDIYRKENEEDPEKPGVCFNWMEKKWNISKKQITIISPYIHFEKMKHFSPFDYKNKSDEDYYSTYNAIKHDRVKNINKATVYSLIRALGALYVLNVYYMESKINLGDDCHATHLDRTFGSQVFVVDIAPCKDIVLLCSEYSIVTEQCICRIIRKESNFIFNLTYRNQFDEIKTTGVFMIDKGFQDYAESCVGKSLDINEFWNNIAKYTKMTGEQFKNDFEDVNKVKDIISVSSNKMKATFWAELNK